MSADDEPPPENPYQAYGRIMARDMDRLIIDSLPVSEDRMTATEILRHNREYRSLRNEIPPDPNAVPIFDANGEPWAPPDPEVLADILQRDGALAWLRSLDRLVAGPLLNLDNPNPDPCDCAICALRKEFCIDNPPPWNRIRETIEQCNLDPNMAAFVLACFGLDAESSSRLRDPDDDATDTLGEDTDDSIGVGEAEAWFRENREESNAED
jgi:hypothetical protein